MERRNCSLCSAVGFAEEGELDQVVEAGGLMEVSEERDSNNSVDAWVGSSPRDRPGENVESLESLLDARGWRAVGGGGGSTGVSLWVVVMWLEVAVAEDEEVEGGEVSMERACSAELLGVTLLLRALLFLSVLLGPGRCSSVVLEPATREESRGVSRSKPN